MDNKSGLCKISSKYAYPASKRTLPFPVTIGKILEAIMDMCEMHEEDKIYSNKK